SLTPLIASGVLLLSFGGVVLGLASSLFEVIVGSILIGVGHITFAVASQTFVTRRANWSNLDSSCGWFTAGISSGQLGGPILGGWLVDTSTTGPSNIASALFIGAGIAAFGVLPTIFPKAGLFWLESGRSYTFPVQHTRRPRVAATVV